MLVDIAVDVNLKRRASVPDRKAASFETLLAEAKGHFPELRHTFRGWAVLPVSAGAEPTWDDLKPLRALPKGSALRDVGCIVAVTARRNWNESGSQRLTTVIDAYVEGEEDVVRTVDLGALPNYPALRGTLIELFPVLETAMGSIAYTTPEGLALVEEDLATPVDLLDRGATALVCLATATYLPLVREDRMDGPIHALRIDEFDDIGEVTRRALFELEEEDEEDDEGGDEAGAAYGSSHGLPSAGAAGPWGCLAWMDGTVVRELASNRDLQTAVQRRATIVAQRRKP